MKSLLFSLLVFSFLVSCKSEPPVPFVEGLEEYPTLQKVLADTAKYQVQILYTQIDRNANRLGSPVAVACLEGFNC